MNEKVLSFIRHPVVIPAAVGVIGTSVGLTSGYLICKRRYGKQLAALQRRAEQLERRADEMGWGEQKPRLTLGPYQEDVMTLVREGLQKIDVKGQVAEMDERARRRQGLVIPDEDFEKLEKLRAEYRSGLGVEEDDEEPQRVPLQRVDYHLEVVPAEAPDGETAGQKLVRNIFEGPEDDWNYDTERAKRTGNVPYVIHRDEFFEKEDDDRFVNSVQTSVTYFVGDNELVDEQERQVPNWQRVLGNELPFGHGSGDPNVVYIRNPVTRVEYEVLRHPGHYRVEILGVQIEEELEEEDLRHARGPRRMREE